MNARDPSERGRRGGPLWRLMWLLLCLAAGVLVGWLGSSWTAQAHWWAAIPASLAVGWWFHADPTQCGPPYGRSDEQPPDENGR